MIPTIQIRKESRTSKARIPEKEAAMAVITDSGWSKRVFYPMFVGDRDSLSVCIHSLAEGVTIGKENLVYGYKH